jgi:hypothetical protein
VRFNLLFNRKGMLLLLPALMMALTTSSTSADPIRHSNGYRFFNNSHGYNGNGSNRHVYNYNSRFNRYSSFNISYSTNRNFQNNDIHGSRYSYRPYSNDGLSVRLNYGTGYNTWYGTTELPGIGAGYRYSPWRNQTTVVYTQPRVIYVNDSARLTSPVSESILNHTTARPARSLLRDINGDCFERTYDSRGVETQVQLPASACNF